MLLTKGAEMAKPFTPRDARLQTRRAVVDSVCVHRQPLQKTSIWEIAVGSEVSKACPDA